MGSGTKTSSGLSTLQKIVRDALGQQLVRRLGDAESVYNAGIGQAYQSSVLQSANMLSRYQPGRYNTEVDSALRRLLSGKVNQTAFRQAVTDPLLRTFDQEIAPRIASGFANAPGFSSRHGTARARALENLMANVSQNQGLFALQAQQDQANAISLALQARLSPLQEAGAVAQLGQSLVSGIDDTSIAQALQFIGTTQQVREQRSNPLGGVISGGLGAAFAGTALGVSQPYMLPLVLAGSAAGALR